jgi:hypothetical protein
LQVRLPDGAKREVGWLLVLKTHQDAALPSTGELRTLVSAITIAQDFPALSEKTLCDGPLWATRDPLAVFGPCTGFHVSAARIVSESSGSGANDSGSGSHVERKSRAPNLATAADVHA